MFCLIALFDLKTRAGIQSCLHLVVLQFVKSRDMTSRLKWVYKGKVNAQVLQLAAIDDWITAYKICHYYWTEYSAALLSFRYPSPTYKLVTLDNWRSVFLWHRNQPSLGTKRYMLGRSLKQRFVSYNAPIRLSNLIPLLVIFACCVAMLLIG